MYYFYYILHNKNGDNMDIDIRKNIYNNLKNEDTNKLLEIINDSVENDDEIVLPGLGVILELVWNNLSNEIKDTFVKELKNKLQNI